MYIPGIISNVSRLTTWGRITWQMLMSIVNWAKIIIILLFCSCCDVTFFLYSQIWIWHHRSKAASSYRLLNFDFRLSKRPWLYELQSFSMSQMTQKAHSALKEIDVPLTKELFQFSNATFLNICHMIWIAQTSKKPLYKTNPGL